MTQRKVVTREMMQRVWKDPPKEDKPHAPTSPRFEIDGWLNTFKVEHGPWRPYQKGSRRLKLKTCPFNPEHGDHGEVALIQFESGALAFTCHHDSCQARKWQDFRAFYDPPEKRSKIIAAKPRPQKLQGIFLNDVQEERIEWLWRGYLPLGMISILAGDGGVGKSFVACDLAMRITTGTPFPFSLDRFGPANVAIFDLENPRSQILVPRLRVAGADLSRCVLYDPGEDEVATFPAALDAPVDFVREHEAEVVVNDTLAAFQDSTLDSHKQVEQRRVMTSLMRLAERTGAAVLALAHLNKNTKANAIHRLMGSVDVVNGARSVMLLGQDPDDEDTRAITTEKTNIYERQEPLAFHLQPSQDPEDPPRLVWDGRRPDLGAFRMLGVSAMSPQERDKVAEAETFLRYELVGGAIEARELINRAKQAGIAEKTLRRAQLRLKIQPRQQNRQWWWELPPEEPTPYQTRPSDHLNPQSQAETGVSDSTVWPSEPTSRPSERGANMTSQALSDRYNVIEKSDGHARPSEKRVRDSDRASDGQITYSGTGQMANGVDRDFEKIAIDFVDDPKVWAETLANFDGTAVVGIDTETTGFYPHRDRLVSIQIACLDYVAVFLCPAEVPECFRDFLEDPSRRKVFHHAAFDWGFFKAVWPDLRMDNVDDTMIARALLVAGDSKGRTSLKNCAKRYLGMELPKEVREAGFTFGELTDEQIEYGAKDAWVTLQVLEPLEEALREQGLWDIYRVECAAAEVTADRRLHGIGVDKEALSELDLELTELRDAAEEKVLRGLEAWGSVAPLEVREAALRIGMKPAKWGELRSFTTYSEGEKMLLAAGVPKTNVPKVLKELGVLNLNAPAQVQQAFEEIGVSLADTRKETLAANGHPIALSKVEYTALTKLQTSFTGPILEIVEGGRVYPEWRQMGTETGRESCASPNIQQIPQRSELGAKIRACFVAGPGKVFVDVDYSQIELRILAELTEDPAMIAAYAAGRDLHVETARTVLNVQGEITKPDRQKAKAVNFGLGYGMGAEKFKQYARDQYGVIWTLEEATAVRSAWLRQYAGVARWHRATANWIRRPDFATRTLGGRLRRFGSNRSYTEALNSPDQGTGADILKCAAGMICREVLIVAMVHDEILVEVDEKYASDCKAFVEAKMIEAGERYLSLVPVTVEGKISKRWEK